MIEREHLLSFPPVEEQEQDPPLRAPGVQAPTPSTLTIEVREHQPVYLAIEPLREIHILAQHSSASLLSGVAPTHHQWYNWLTRSTQQQLEHERHHLRGERRVLDLDFVKK